MTPAVALLDALTAPAHGASSAPQGRFAAVVDEVAREIPEGTRWDGTAERRSAEGAAFTEDEGLPDVHHRTPAEADEPIGRTGAASEEPVSGGAPETLGDEQEHHEHHDDGALHEGSLPAGVEQGAGAWSLHHATPPPVPDAGEKPLPGGGNGTASRGNPVPFGPGSMPAPPGSGAVPVPPANPAGAELAANLTGGQAGSQPPANPAGAQAGSQPPANPAGAQAGPQPPVGSVPAMAAGMTGPPGGPAPVEASSAAATESGRIDARTLSHPAVRWDPVKDPAAPAGPAATDAVAPGAGAAPAALEASVADAASMSTVDLEVDPSDPEEEWSEPLARAMALRARSGDGRMKIRLHPPSLGEVTMDLHLRGHALNVRMNVESHAARHLPSGHLPGLRGALEGMGISVETLRVDVESRLEDSPSHPSGGREDPPGEGPRGDGGSSHRGGSVGTGDGSMGTPLGLAHDEGREGSVLVRGRVDVVA